MARPQHGLAGWGPQVLPSPRSSPLPSDALRNHFAMWVMEEKNGNANKTFASEPSSFPRAGGEVPEHKASPEHPSAGPAGKRLVRGWAVKWEFVLLSQTLPGHAELLLGACFREGGGVATPGCFDADGTGGFFPPGSLVKYIYISIYTYT